MLCKNEYRGHDEYKTDNVDPGKRGSQPQYREQGCRNRFDAGDNARFRCANIFNRLEVQGETNDGAKQHQAKEQEQPARKIKPRIYRPRLKNHGENNTANKKRTSDNRDAP